MPVIPVMQIMPLSLSQAMKNTRHSEKVEREKAAQYQVDETAPPLSFYVIALVDSYITTSAFGASLGLFKDIYLERGLSGLWSSIVMTKGMSSSPVSVLALALNDLLCDPEVSGQIHRDVIERLITDDFVANGMEAIGYHYENEPSTVVLDRVNFLRFASGELIPEEAVDVLVGKKLNDILLMSACAFGDLEAINNFMSRHVRSTKREEVLRTALRAKGVTHDFTKLALSGRSTINGFANDVIYAVKSGRKEQLDRVFDAGMVYKCSYELITKLMKDSYLNAKSIPVVEHFVKRVIEIGCDTYRPFVMMAYGEFTGLDQLEGQKLSSNSILDIIYGQRHTNTAGNLRSFLPAIPEEDIRNHPHACGIYEMLHEMTGEERYFKRTSAKYRGATLSSDLGI
ncbi:hypothetical protein [Pseudomonas putida]|uniref:Uncharacterized protein n=1 Tax=Pseudomonas putida TaxID=303 RepID=A0A8I1EFS3_PSEPU|nr:hypothetical protein [Pseudomonas putida]MBI6885870.1 hypothetical protein [Pseudomonas putida]